MCIKNLNHMRYSSWDTKWDRNIFVILGHFCLFTLIMISKIKILKKWKKMPGDIILLHMYTINEDHMMCDILNIRCSRQNFLSFGIIFCSFTPPNNPENPHFEKLKKTFGDIINLLMSTINDNHDVWPLRYKAQQTYF